MDFSEIDTPFTVIDHERLVSNLERHLLRTQQQGIASRPHAKTHKIPEIAKLQLEYGARGITLATIGEAEVFVEAGIDDIFLAYPLWLTPRKAARLQALAARARVGVGVDSVAGIRQAATTLGTTTIEFMVEVDSGHHRSGIDPHQVVPLAQALADHNLALRGVFTYPGHSYQPDTKDDASQDEVTALTIATSALESAGFEVLERSGGSTPSVHSTQSFLTETRAGVYALGDAQQLELGGMDMNDVALSVVTTVVSARGQTVVVDAGSKIMGADKASWASGHGRVLGHADARIVAMSEHHATVVFPDSDPAPRCGDIIQVIPNHVCNAVNLVDSVLVKRARKPAQVWLVAARGKNS
ncbi:alanine racemase [Pontimonas sp.]|nr:alanine racemase [Pontimonas sp.]